MVRLLNAIFHGLIAPIAVLLICICIILGPGFISARYYGGGVAVAVTLGWWLLPIVIGSVIEEYRWR